MMLLIVTDVEGYIVIGLVKFIWKVCVSIVNNILQSTIILHKTLHGFRRGRGTGMEIMEENLEQQLTVIFHEPLLQVFIDVQKAYDSLYRGICMEIIRGYGMGPKIQRLL